jgi:hypothetical protein
MDETAPRTFVFVLMPFSDHFTDIYEAGIKPACRDAGGVLREGLGLSSP